jgi:hypothetical protein
MIANRGGAGDLIAPLEILIRIEHPIPDIDREIVDRENRTHSVTVSPDELADNTLIAVGSYAPLAHGGDAR